MFKAEYLCKTTGQISLFDVYSKPKNIDDLYFLSIVKVNNEKKRQNRIKKLSN